MRHSSLIQLSHDHHHGLALALRCRKQALGRLKPMGIEGLKERAEEFRVFFGKNLERHFKAEEEILFPFMRATAEAALLIDDLLRDHAQLRAFSSTLAAETGLAKTLFDAGDLLERHIRREERELFPLFEKQAGAGEAETIKAQIGEILAC
jgi:iron-sulfur cluster repair protein YtfE (RIC family)